MKLGQSAVVKRSIEMDELDAGGVLYHAHYIKICDQVRNHYYAQMGFDFLKQKEMGFALAVVDVNARYLRITQLVDVYVVTRIVNLTKKTCRIKQVFTRSEPSSQLLNELGDAIEKLPDLHFSAEFTLVGLSFSTTRACEIPPQLLTKLGL